MTPQRLTPSTHCQSSTRLLPDLAAGRRRRRCCRRRGCRRSARARRRAAPRPRRCRTRRSARRSASTPRRAELGDRVVERVLLDVGQHDLHARGPEPVRHRPADARRRAGDDRDLPLELLPCPPDRTSEGNGWRIPPATAFRSSLDQVAGAVEGVPHLGEAGRQRARRRGGCGRAGGCRAPRPASAISAAPMAAASGWRTVRWLPRRCRVAGRRHLEAQRREPLVDEVARQRRERHALRPHPVDAGLLEQGDALVDRGHAEDRRACRPRSPAAPGRGSKSAAIANCSRCANQPWIGERSRPWWRLGDVEEGRRARARRSGTCRCSRRRGRRPPRRGRSAPRRPRG